jgi:hypothetical protein
VTSLVEMLDFGASSTLALAISISVKVARFVVAQSVFERYPQHT